MDKLEFEARLNKTYNGGVTPVTRYTNKNATMLFHCDKCGTDFYNKARYMIEKDHQKHICTMPYGDSFGTRLSNVGKGKIDPKKRKKQLNPDKVVKRLYQMIIEDYTPQQIAKELQVNPNIIKDHFKAEGLI
ncbi:adenylate kinase [Bacillus cereus]|uniref:adenylate kinase n=1 Tax=Bacillus cereus TaxID=1396 RepID=UPI001F5CC8E9|nr:adenylate kinase [Bacillus cereus]MCI3146179.1 adenylate kinase [Bacillus cereus]